MDKTRSLHLIGCAAGVAGADKNSGLGPLTIQKSSFLTDLIKKYNSLQWEAMLQSEGRESLPIDQSVRSICEQLAKKVSGLVKQEKRIVVIGGDHSCAIGTWSGVYDAMHQQGEIGLIWVDAHMDSHTPETSESGRIHGMPLACLLGHGYPSLTTILHHAPKIKPENLFLIGVRSFERGEAELLKRLNVRVYFMDEVRERGLSVVFNEAVNAVKQNTFAYGLSIDIDAIDPQEAPGVDVPEANGILASDLCGVLREVASDPKLIATEIVEFDPKHDMSQMTEKLIVTFLKILTEGNENKI